MEYSNTPSRSQNKRSAENLEKIGKYLIEQKKLPANINYPEELMSAVITAKSIKVGGGYRRQLLYVAKLIRQWNEDDENEVNKLRLICESEKKDNRNANRLESAVNNWVMDIVADTLSGSQKTLTRFIDIYPAVTENHQREINNLLTLCQNNSAKIKLVKVKLAKLIREIICL